MDIFWTLGSNALEGAYVHRRAVHGANFWFSFKESQTTRHTTVLLFFFCI